MTLRLRSAFTCCAFAGLALASCGDESQDGVANASSFAEGCSQYVEALCGWMFQCGNFDKTLAYGSYANCKTAEYDRCIKLAELPGQGWRPADYSACANTYYTLSCEIPLDGTKVGDCRQKPGGLKVGQACAVSTQCESLYCTSEGAVAGSCGLCVARAAEGEPCLHDAMCDADQRCVVRDASSSLRICTVRQPLSASCDASHPCESLSSCVAGTCTRLAGVGENCAVSEAARQCDPYQGLYCNPMTERCELKTNANLGEACAMVDVAFKICVFGSSCIATVDSGGSICIKNAALGGGCDDVVGPGCAASQICLDGICKDRAYVDCR